VQVARAMVDRGARHVVLFGRHRQPSLVAELEAAGAEVFAAEGDVARREDVRAVLDAIAERMPPLRGVVHAAGVVDDATLVQQDWAKFERVLSPKVAGAWNLHSLSKESPLDFFVLFSSMVALFGASGQGNYAAANAFLDALAGHRRALGYPAISINWGPWAGNGMAGAVDDRHQQRWAQLGVDLMPVDSALAAFERLLRDPIAPQVGVLPVRWNQVIGSAPGGRVPPFISELAVVAAAPAAVRADRRPDIRQELDRTPPARRHAVLLNLLRAEAGKVLSLDASVTIDVREPLSELGLDSLMAVELRNSIGDLVGRSLPATLLFKYPTLDALAQYVLDDVLQLAEAEAAEPDAGTDPDVAEVESMADDDIKRLLFEELKALETES
jgi:polyketide synthase 12/myxalamid-type polyketide synthase MxaB